MRTHGTLIKWNDERGFGFVAVPQSYEEIFVHISAFPRDGVRPRAGETISFEIHTAPDGRKRAEVIERPGFRKASRKHEVSRRVRSRSSVDSLFVGAAVLVLGFVAYNSYVSRQNSDMATSVSTDIETADQPFSAAIETADQSFRCDGRTHCSQMASCAEARYFLKRCPGTQMDGDGDGEPCERQWCN